MMSENQFDDYYNDGFYEMARQGKHTLIRNNMSPEEMQTFSSCHADRYEAKKAEINAKVLKIRNDVINCDPLVLLEYAKSRANFSHMGKFSEIEYSDSENISVRALEYIQSIIVASDIKGFPVESKEEQQIHMDTIFDELEDLYKEFIHFYLYWSSYIDKKDNLGKDLLMFIVEAQMLYWVRGNRYQIFQLELLKKLLPPHDKILIELFGMDSKQILGGLDALEYSLSQGIGDAVSDIVKAYEKFQLLIEQGIDPEQAVLQSNTGFANAKASPFEKAFGTILNDVSAVTTWTSALIDALTYKINECENFYGDFDFSGWPISSLPINRKPFIELNGRSFCFSYYSLFDNFYRIIQKEIMRLRPAYKEEWNRRQELASVDMVSEVFRNLLPGAQTFTSNFYPKENSLKHCHENDLLVLYDDVLLIVEVKAGSFPQSPPITDYKAHVSAYKALIERTDHQCNNTLRYVEGKSKVIFYSKDKHEKFSIDIGSIRETFNLAITIEDLGDFSSRAEKISFLTLKSNSIALSCDNLLEYAKYFDSPLYFLHFLRQRKAATTVEQIALHDELDHLGMYIEYNMYPLYAIAFPAENRIYWHGFREELDNYFNRLYRPEISIEKPTQEVPDLIGEIIKVLEEQESPRRTYLSSFLLDFSTDAKSDFVRTVQEVFRRQMQENRTIPVGAFGNARYCLFIIIDGMNSWSIQERSDFTYVFSMRNTECSTTWIDLFMDKSCRVLTVNSRECCHSDLEADDYARISAQSIQYAKDRVAAQRRNAPNRKVGRNEACPCGSGKKYKHCCLNMKD